jgi:hypothetical protein
MRLTESDARQLLEVIRRRLQEIEAREVLEGIEESRRLGAEESLHGLASREVKHVGTMRRRPLTAIEELSVVFRHLQERLVVVPLLAASIQVQLRASEVEWRVDTEFVSESRIPEVEITRLAPEGYAELRVLIAAIMQAAEISATARVE